MRCQSVSQWMCLLLPVALLSASPALAAVSTATVGVTAEVLPACSAGSTSTGNLGSFGTLDFGTHASLASPISLAGQVGNGALRINCVTNTPFRVLISAGSSGDVTARHMVGASAQISYNLYTSASHLTVWDNTIGVSGVGTGQDSWLTVYALVPAQTLPPAGVYSDTVTITVSW